MDKTIWTPDQIASRLLGSLLIASSFMTPNQKHSPIYNSREEYLMAVRKWMLELAKTLDNDPTLFERLERLQATRDRQHNRPDDTDKTPVFNRTAPKKFSTKQIKMATAYKTGRKKLKSSEQVLEAIESWAANHGHPPTLNELKGILDVGSKRTIQRYLDSLVRQGYIEKTPGARGIRVLRKRRRETQNVLTSLD